MGHSSINESLIYLKGLEIAELIEEDMPMVEGYLNKKFLSTVVGIFFTLFKYFVSFEFLKQ